MGFKAVKDKVINCLKTGNIYHEIRHDVDIKNVLSTGVVTADEVAAIIGRSRGDSYSSSPHHLDCNIDVHIVKTKFAGFNWYIKWYFLEPDAIFISVHH
ncbi:MAG: hypothetical protein ACI8WB_001592 [Phenylobacterium sp.]|jgi:hypothetical protein